MNETTAKFDSEKNDVLVGNNVQTIFDHLNDLEKESQTYSKRWFWELLQNAKDAVESDEKVSVKVVLEGDRLSFYHTGNPFKKHDILHLIYHGSSKKSLENKTGRFGTGFMSTHLLSRIVNIVGQLDDGSYFGFELNREGESVEIQYQNLETSYEKFCLSNGIQNHADGIFNTAFSYVLPPQNIKIAINGIDQLEKILPFVMAFNPKIKDIQIFNNGLKTTVNRGDKENIAFMGKELILQTVFYNKIENKVLFSESDTFDIGILLEKDENEMNSIVELDESYPKLFFDFPLFGTEKIGLAAVINSNYFDLKKERDGIYLLEDDVNKVTIIENKKIVAEAIIDFETLIAYSAERKYSQFYNLFKIRNSFEYSWLHLDWINGLNSSLIDKIINTPYHSFEKGLLKINEFIIPYSETIAREDFYKLLTDLKPGYIPEWHESDQWVNIAKEYSLLQKKSVGDYAFVIDESKLCQRLEQAGNLDTINAIFATVTEEPNDYTEAVAWFNRMFNLLSKELTEQLSSVFAFIPNQNKKFIKRVVNSPYFDEIGNEDIKKVAQGFDWDLKATLIFSGIETKAEIFQKSYLDNILNGIDKICNDITEEDLNVVTMRTALIGYLDWLILSKKVELIKNAYVIVEKGRESTNISYSKRRLYQSGVDKLLAPTDIWPEMSIYSDIIPKKFVLIGEYAELLTPYHFDYLVSEDLIYISPLINRRNPNKNELKLLVRKKEDYSKLLNDKEEIINNDIEFSDIAYLNRSDDNILAKTADSVKSAKTLLNFLLAQVITKDTLFNTSGDLDTGTENISINRCLWISRLKDTSWVPHRPLEEEKTISERPSVANITELLKDDSELSDKLKRKEAGLFFNQIGISIADIRRNSLPNEEDRLKWDMAFSDLIGNGNINPDLAVEMLADPKLQEIYLNQKKQKESIMKNQNIGFAFEKAFRQIFEQDSYKQQGFSIERKPVGSDFGLIYEEDITDDAGNEVLFKINNEILIELKATGKNYAEMTPKQAETANDNIANYVLAVLPLDFYEINEENVVLHSRFVIDIANPLSLRYKDFKSYAQKKEEATTEKSDVKLNIEDGNIRYQVKSEIWEVVDTVIGDAQPSLSFIEFIEWLRRKNEGFI